MVSGRVSSFLEICKQVKGRELYFVIVIHRLASGLRILPVFVNPMPEGGLYFNSFVTVTYFPSVINDKLRAIQNFP